MYGLSKKQKLKFILEKIEELNITAYDIGKKTGLSTSGIDKIINGNVKNPHENTLNTILDYLEEKVLGTNIKENIHKVEEPKLEYNEPKTANEKTLTELLECEKEKNKLISEIYKLQAILNKNNIPFKNIFETEEI